LDDFKDQYSGKDFVSNNRSNNRPKSVFGGELRTDMGQVITNVCVKDLSFSTEGQGPMSFGLTIHTCGIKIAIKGVKAKLNLSGALAGKTINVSIDEFRLKDSGKPRSFSVFGELGVDSAGVLRVNEKMRVVGLEDLSDIDQYSYKTIGSDAGGISGKIKKNQRRHHHSDSSRNTQPRARISDVCSS